MKKILIIDDDPVILKYLMAVFSDNGYETCTANSSTEGLEVVKQEKPDLITLDSLSSGAWMRTSSPLVPFRGRYLKYGFC